MPAGANRITNLQQLVTRTITGNATHSAFVLRKAAASNGMGGTVGAFQPTTETAIDCFCSPVPESQITRENMRGTQRRPGNFWQFVFTSDVDITEADKIRRNAAFGLPQSDMEVIRVTPQIGLAIVVIAYEESPL